MSEVNKSLDAILIEIGQLGKYQCFVLTLVALSVILHSTVHIAFVFTAKDINYRCEIPDCESDPPQYNPSWLPNAVPFVNGLPAKCETFRQLNYSEHESCSPFNFNRSVVDTCHKYVYETTEITLVNDFDLHCDENLWKLTLIGTVNSVGQFVGLPLSGYVSDRYGRRTTLIWGMVMCGVAGLIRSFMNSYVWFNVFEFLDAAFGGGAYSCAFVLGAELVGPKRRVLISTLISSSFALGEIITGAVAWGVQSWRPLVQILYAFPLLLISYYWLTPESVRWLLVKKRFAEATDILKKAAKVNGKTVSEDNLSKLGTDDNHSKSEKYPITDLFKSVVLIMRFINCCFCWIACVFVYYGLTLNSVALAGNSYLDFILTSFVEIPGYIATYLVVDKLGRRTTECGALLITGLACITFIFIPTDLYWLKLTIYLVGKCGSTIAFSVCYIISSEIFPTPLRHSLIATCSMFGRIGSMIAPQMPLLEQFWKPLPLILFGGMSASAGVLCLLFPETVNTKLPDTIEEAENIGKTNCNAKPVI